ncbi:ComEA family DNA-binding protein [Thalassobacillus pellis]|uniref:ComEA family DNA-binding protein n=1 Tax=Thalassobacillus pellis TaxID=748008 RepID=UPI00196083C2|nr:helix-hairpin-helix domain-containing protein [Thalassobacillus pellis]MBM7553228.1 DNA uptake protein ComE-like DNA-binding protein [Thalassobacillus pellis]
MYKQITNKGKVWELRNSIWMLWSLLTFGFLNYISFFYIAYRVKQKKWTISGIVYSLIFILFIVITEVFPSNHWVYNIFAILFIAGYVASIIHVFKVRPEYLLRLEAVKKLSDYKYETLKKEIQHDYQMNETIPKVSKPVQEYNVGNTLNKFENKNTVTCIDINKATVEELAKIPYLDGIFAKKIVELRSVNGNFTSKEQFIDQMKLKPHIANKVLPHILISENKINKKEKSTGRIVDY